MSVSFHPDLSDAISRVRQYIGDTDVAHASIQDETITAYLASKSEYASAAQLCRDLAAAAAVQVNTGFDRQQTDESDIFKHYMELAVRFDQLAQGENTPTDISAVPYGFSGIAVGGVCSDRPSWSPDYTWGFYGPWGGYDRC